MFYRLLSFFFHLLYHPFAWGYDAVAAVVSGGQWKNWILTVEEHLVGADILELGHGPGHLQAHLQTAHALSIGLDESRQMGRLAHKALAKTLPGQAPLLVRGKAQALPLPTASFDSVVATFPSEYIFSEDCLREVRRVLRPGGRVVALLAAQIIGTSLIARFLKALYTVTGETAGGEVQGKVLHRFHEHGFDAEIRWETGKYARLMVIVAQKTDCCSKN